MKTPVDISNIELSKAEYKVLSSIFEQGFVSDSLLEREPYAYLYRIKLVERSYSSELPYCDRGEISIPLNALRVSDAGRSYLARTMRISKDALITRAISVLALLVSIATLVYSVFSGLSS